MSDPCMRNVIDIAERIKEALKESDTAESLTALLMAFSSICISLDENSMKSALQQGVNALTYIKHVSFDSEIH